MPIKCRVNVTTNIIVKVGKMKIVIDKVIERDFRESKIGKIAGGEDMQLYCEGSKIAMVELIGETLGLMQMRTFYEIILFYNLSSTYASRILRQPSRFSNVAHNSIT